VPTASVVRASGRRWHGEIVPDRAGSSYRIPAVLTTPTIPQRTQRSQSWSLRRGRYARQPCAAGPRGDGRAVATLTTLGNPYRALGGALGPRRKNDPLCGCITPSAISPGFPQRGVRVLEVCVTELGTYLHRFWRHAESGKDRLWLLREAAAWRVAEVREYRHRRNGAARKPPATGRCWVCDGRRATCRHHVVQLQHGGRNTDKNLVDLCRRCHVLVHPWMLKKPPMLGTLSQPCDMRPRLVKNPRPPEAL
jgi:hypothetical protein